MSATYIYKRIIKGETGKEKLKTSGFGNNEQEVHSRQVVAHFYRWLSNCRLQIAGADIYCEIFACYMPLGTHSIAFVGEIEATFTALPLLNLHLNKFERADIFSDSKFAILSAG